MNPLLLTHRTPVLIESPGPHPKTSAPTAAWRDRLQPGILAFVRQVHPADDGGQRLEADELAGLPFRRCRQPDRRHRERRAEQRLYYLAARFDPEVRPPIGVAFEIGESV